MADVWAEVVEFTADTIGSGTQTISLSTHSSDTPKAAMFFMTQATAVDTLTANCAASWGVASSTTATNASVSIQCEDGADPTNTDRRTTYGNYSLNLGRVLQILSSTGTLAYEARLQSWNTGSITLDVPTTAPAGYKGIAIVFGGTDLTSYCGKLDAPASGGTVSATPNFETNLCFLGGNDTVANDATVVVGSLQLGAFAYNNPTITQATVNSLHVNAAGTGETNSAVHNAECYAAMNSSTINYVLACTSVTSTQFTLTQTQITGSDTTDDIIYLALGGLSDSYVGLVNPSSSTGTAVAYTDIGFESEIIGYINTRQTAEATAAGDGDGAGGSMAFSVVDYGTDGTDGTAVSLSLYDQDGSAAANTATRYSDQLWYLLDDAQGTNADWQCTHVSIDPTGNTVNQSGAAGSASAYFLKWAIESPNSLKPTVVGFEYGDIETAGAASNTSPVTIPVPAGLQDGELWLVCLAMDTDPAPTGGITWITPTGWTECHANLTGDGNGWPQVKTWYRIASSETDQDFEWTGYGTYGCNYRSLRIANVDQTSPFDVAGTTVFTTNSDTREAPDVTVAENDSLAVLFYWAEGISASGDTLDGWTSPTGTTILPYDTYASGESDFPVGATAHQRFVPAGSYSPSTWTVTRSTSSRQDNDITITLIFKPVSSGGTLDATRLAYANFCNTWDDLLPIADSSIPMSERYHLLGCIHGLSTPGTSTLLDRSFNRTLGRGFKRGGT